MDVWRYQYRENGLYRTYCHLLGKSLKNVEAPENVPFLPIQLFKDHEIKSGNWEPQVIFRSSGTTDDKTSSHFIRDLDWYHRIAEKCFDHAFGKVSNYHWLALLPTYLERRDSSLVDMVNHFTKVSLGGSYFFPQLNKDVFIKLREFADQNAKTILIGVSFALLDLFQEDVPVWPSLKVMETGGMKGRRPEMTREELHAQLKQKYPALDLSSEYGMTELLSQAYYVQDHFQPGPFMKVFVRDITDPISLLKTGERGGLNIIDLANLDTCSFIATDDSGIVHADGNFDVLGRLDQSEIRGCNLLYTDT